MHQLIIHTITCALNRLVAYWYLLVNYEYTMHIVLYYYNALPFQSSRDVTVGGTYMNHAASLVVDINAYRFRTQYRTVLGQLQDTLTLGSTHTPEPIGYTLVSISDMLDQSHWQNMDSYKKRGLCPPSEEAALTFQRTHLEKAVLEYSGLLGAHTPVCKYTSLRKLLLVWIVSNFHAVYIKQTYLVPEPNWTLNRRYCYRYARYSFFLQYSVSTIQAR